MKCKLFSALTHMVQNKCSREESSQAFLLPVVCGNFHNEPVVVIYGMKVTKWQMNPGGSVEAVLCKVLGAQGSGCHSPVIWLLLFQTGPQFPHRKIEQVVQMISGSLWLFHVIIVYFY